MEDTVRFQWCLQGRVLVSELLEMGLPRQNTRRVLQMKADAHVATSSCCPFLLVPARDQELQRIAASVSRSV